MFLTLRARRFTLLALPVTIINNSGGCFQAQRRAADRSINSPTARARYASLQVAADQPSHQPLLLRLFSGRSGDGRFDLRPPAAADCGSECFCVCEDDSVFKPTVTS